MAKPYRELAIASLFLTAAAGQATEARSAFVGAMNRAMDRMMLDMHAPSTGDADQDFVRMMIPHHRGAIEMAFAELRYGTNPHLKRIAQEIIVEQQQEIAAMDLAAGASLPLSADAPTRQIGNEPMKDDGHAK